MGFLVPAFLAGLAALVVPVVLHLRHRDKDKPHRFPSLMFLERLPIRTAERRRITDWPLLLLRALALVLLAVAFARPVLWTRRAADPRAGERTVVVLLDRSLSMSHRDVWPAAIDSARRVVNALRPDDRVAVVLFDDEAEVAQPLTGDHALARAALAKARPGAGGTHYAAALRAARQLVADARGATADVVVITDLQRSGASGVAGLELPKDFSVRTVAVAARDRSNAHLGPVEAHRDVLGDRQMVSIQSRIESHGSTTSRRMTAMLRLDGRPSGAVIVTVPGTGDARLTFASVPLPAGLVRGEITIDHDALAADDTAHFTLSADDVVRVLLVAPDEAGSEETMYLGRALAVGGAPPVRLERVRAGQLDARMLGGASLVMLWDGAWPSGSAGSSLAEWVSRGGGLVVVAGSRLGARAPSAPLMPARVTGRADRADDGGGSLGDVRLDHPLLAPFREARSALYAPRFLRYARLEPSPRAQVLARFDDGAAAIVERREGAGRIVMVSVPLDARAGDFPLQPAYLPFVRRLVLYTSGRGAASLARTTGESWMLPGVVREPVVSTPGGSIVRPARDAQGATVPLREAGIYSLHEGAASAAPTALLAVNAPSSESDLTPMTAAELLVGARLDSTSAARAAEPPAPAEAERRQGLWRLLLAALGLLLLTEMFVANRGWRGSADHLTVVRPEGSGR
jgi:hypothetical protein